MTNHLTRRVSRILGKHDEGFTLIELLVVLLIIGILLAIAIPTFLSVTKTANNTAAAANLQTAFTGANTYYTSNNQSYVGLDFYSANAATSDITQIDTGLSYASAAAGAGDSTSSHVVAVEVVNANGLILAAWAQGTNRCYYLVDNKTANAAGVGNGTNAVGTWYGYSSVTDSSKCTPVLVTNVATGTGKGHFVNTGFPS